MKMEMSYRDKVILIVLFILIILVGGFFALIKPKYEKWQDNTDKYETTKTEWDGIEQKLKAIEPLKKGITETYEEAKKTAKIFENTAFVTANKTYCNEKTSYEIDQYLQPAIDAAELEVTSMGISNVAAKTMNYYYYTPNVLTYSLLEAADINGNYAQDIAELLYDSIVLSERETVEVMGETIELNVQCTKAQLMTFLEAIDSDNNAVLIESVSIADYQFLGGLETEQVGPDGQPVINTNPNAEGTSSVTIVITFYNAKAIDQPELGA